MAFWDVIAGFLPGLRRTGHGPGMRPPRTRTGPCHETHLSSFQSPPRPYAWLPRPDEDTRRACRHQCAARQGPQAPRGLSCGAARRRVAVIGRLQRSADFARVLHGAPRARSARFALHHAPPEPVASDLSTGGASAGSRPVDDIRPRALAGVIVPKRHARRAVTRSLVKRAARAALARHEAELPGGVWVIRLRAPIDPARYPSAASAPLRAELCAELDALVTQALR